MMLAAISPMIAWAAYFVAVYALQGLGCDRGWNQLSLAGSNALTLSLVALTAVALAGIAWQVWHGWRTRGRFTGRLLLALAVVAWLATLFSGIPVLMLEPCRA